MKALHSHNVRPLGGVHYCSSPLLTLLTCDTIPHHITSHPTSRASFVPQNLYIGYSGKLLENSQTLAAYDIQNNSTIRLEYRAHSRRISLATPPTASNSTFDADSFKSNFETLIKAACDGDLGRMKAFEPNSLLENCPKEARIPREPTALHIAAQNGPPKK